MPRGHPADAERVDGPAARPLRFAEHQATPRAHHGPGHPEPTGQCDVGWTPALVDTHDVGVEPSEDPSQSPQAADTIASRAAEACQRGHPACRFSGALCPVRRRLAGPDSDTHRLLAPNLLK